MFGLSGTSLSMQEPVHTESVTMPGAVGAIGEYWYGRSASRDASTEPASARNTATLLELQSLCRLNEQHPDPENPNCTENELLTWLTVTLCDVLKVHSTEAGLAKSSVACRAVKAPCTGSNQRQIWKR